MKQRLRAAIAAGAAVLLAGGGIGSSMALADTGSDISETVVKDLKIIKSINSDPVSVGEKARLEGTFDSSPSQVKAGDFFTVGFPAEFRAPDTKFDLKDDSGTKLADCVSGGTGNNSLKCVFNEEAASRGPVKGSFFVDTRAEKETEKTEVDFRVGTTVRSVALPNGGKIVKLGRGDMPGAVNKYGFAGNKGNELVWEVVVPAKSLGEGAEVTLTDTISGGATYVPGTTVNLTYFADAEAYADNKSSSTRLQEGSHTATVQGIEFPYSLTFSEDRQTFDLKMPNFDPGADGLYILTYASIVPEDTISGTRFTNNANINGVSKIFGQTWKSVAGGDINAPGFGGLLVSKVATGDTDALKSGQAFTVLATWTDAAGAEQQQEITVTAGGKPGSLQQIPQDTVVTLTEVKNPIEGAAYDETFSSSDGNVKIEDGGKTAKVTIGDRTQTNVRLTNDITKEETPPTTETPTETPTEEPTDTPTEEPTDTPTEEPTDTPTEEPTDTPTEEPTDTPTEEPTDTPTEEPTDTPTQEPTDTPTEEPTDTPTEEPTDTPTEEPTDTPTEEPTDTPTEEPTDTPTTSPTVPWSNPTSTPTPGSPSPNQPGNPGNPGNGTTGGGTGGSNTGNSSTGGGSLSRTGMEFPMGLLAAGVVTLTAGLAMRRTSSREA